LGAYLAYCLTLDLQPLNPAVVTKTLLQANEIAKGRALGRR